MPRRSLFLLLLLPLLAGAATDNDYIDLSKENIYKVAPFTLTERSGKTVTLEDLKGKVWVASFFFSACSRACGPMNANLAELHQSLADRPDVLLVSISVYPEQDTPDALRAYAKALRADPNRWLFLTGPQEEIYKLTRNSFMQPVTNNIEIRNPVLAASSVGLGSSIGVTLPEIIRNSEASTIAPSMAVDHTSYLTLVDRKGNISGILTEGTKPELVRRFEKRIRDLAGPSRNTPFPAINASLNAGCAVLITLGYLAIRARREKLHMYLMLAALGLSAIFLGSYLYYHIVVMKFAHTVFPGQGAARIVYLTILLSHTVLAAIVAPLALYTAFVGLRDRRPRHIWLAKWTLPMWLYVSVTGVLVYLMLYHLYPPA